MGTSITIRNIDPKDKSWLRREARQAGVSMEELVRHLIHEQRTKTKPRPKPSEVFARHFGEQHGVELPTQAGCGYRTQQFSSEGEERLPLEGQSLAALREQDVMPLPPFTPPGASEGTFLSAAHAADLLGVAKSTVTRKIEKNEVIGFRTFTNALRIPEEQFEHGDVVAGIPQVLALFTEESSEGQMHADHKGAWDFLTTVVYPGDAAPRPIDRLKAGMRNRKSHEVVAELGRVKESLDYGDHI